MVDADTYAYEPASERPFPRGRVSGWMIGIGALVVLIASLLPWATIDVDLGAIGGASTSQVALGFETDDGRLFLAIAAVVLLLGVGVRWTSGTAKRALGVLALSGAVAVVAVAAIDLSSVEESAREALAEDLADQAGLTEREAEEELAPYTRVSTELGLYVALAGGGLATLGALVAALRGGRRRSDRPAETPAWSGSTVAYGGSAARPVGPEEPVTDDSETVGDEIDAIEVGDEVVPDDPELP